MKKHISDIFVFIVVICFVAYSFVTKSTAVPTIITVTDNQWDSQKLHNAIARIIVEHGWEGFTLKESTASSQINWQSLLSGEIDLDIESWTSNMVTYDEDIALGDAVEIGTLVPDSRQGLYVPRYVIEGDPARNIPPLAPDLKTVADLKKYPHIFIDDENPEKGRIYGAIPGWNADSILHNKYQYYTLDTDYTYARLGSEATLFSSLLSAYNLGEPWVGYCYEPTWISGKLDIVLLEDAPFDPAAYPEGKCEFPEEQLRIVSSRRFAQRAPELLPFFENYRTGSALIAEALAYLDETRLSYDEVAIWFLKEHYELLDEWLPTENASRVRAYLDTMP